MKINIIKPVLPSIDLIYEDFKECLENGLVTNNSKFVKKLEEELQIYLSSKLKPILFCNGEMALFHLIQAQKIKMGYHHNQTFKVLVPSVTFSGTINALYMNNLEPIFCDVDEKLIINLKKCNIDNNVKMLVIVGAYGNIPNIDEVIEFSKKNNICVIFDNAPAFGSTYKNKYINSFGFSEIYSLHASKNFTTMEGGLVVTEDEEIWEILQYLRDFGQYEKTRGNIKYPGLNSKMQEISAIVGLHNLKNIENSLIKRKKVIEKYIEFFSSDMFKPFFSLMEIDKNVFCNYLYFPLILNENAENFTNFMSKNDITVRRYYTAVHELDFYSGKFSNLDLNFTNKIKDSLVSLPLHTDMIESEIDYLFNTVKKYFNI